MLSQARGGGHNCFTSRRDPDGRRGVRVSIRIVLAVSAVSFLCAALVGQPTAGASMPQLTSTGSRLPPAWRCQSGRASSTNWMGATSTSPFQVRWIGVNSFCQNTVNLALSDLSYAAGQSTAATRRCRIPTKYVPDVAGCLCLRIQPGRHDGETDHQAGTQRHHDRRDLHRSHPSWKTIRPLWP